MGVDLNAVAMFVRVVECGSFSEAAARLGTPLSTVSRKISELEESLHVRLLERSTRRLRVTEFGQEYYESSRRGLEELQAGAAKLHDRQSQIAGTLRMSVPPNLDDVLVVPLVCAFQTSYPEVKVKIFVTDRHVDLIEDGVDLALRVGKLADSNLIARCLLVYRHMLVASPKYLATHGTPKHPEELSQHRLLGFAGWNKRVVWELTNKRKTHTLNVDGVLTTNEITGIQYAAEVGQGIADIPSLICGAALKSKRLIEILPRWRFQPTQLSLVHVGNRNVSRIVGLFKTFCVEHIQQLALHTGL